MKRILLWDGRRPAASPLAVEIDDALAALLVQSGVAAPADPADSPALAGPAILTDDMVNVILWSGFERTPMAITLPASIANVAIASGADITVRHGSSSRLATFPTLIPSASGPVLKLPGRTASPRSFAKTAGDANLSIASDGTISAASIPPSGIKQRIEATETGSDGKTRAWALDLMVPHKRVRPPVVLNPATSTAGWTSNSAAVLSFRAAPEPHPDGRTQFLAIKCLAADTFCGGRTFTIPANFKLADAYLVGMWVYWDAANGSAALRFTSDGFASKTKTFSWAWSGQLHRGWNLLTVNPAGTATTNPGGTAWSVAGGMLDSEVVNAIEVQVSTNGAADTEIFVGQVFYLPGKPTKGAVILGFDKYGEASIPQIALPIMEAAGIKGYWAGDANLIETPTNARAYLKQVYDAGWDAITQGKNHPDYTQPASKAVLAADIDYARAIMQANGFIRSLMHFSYPLSANDPETDAILASKGVPMARSGWSWQIHPNEYNGGPKLIGHGATNLGGKTLTAIKQMVDAAVYYGTTLNLFTHGIVAGGTGTTPPADPLYWYQADFQSLIDYLVAYRDQGVLDIDSPTQWLAKRT